MNPDVGAAVLRLQREGILTPEQAEPLARAARGELVSVRPELRLLLYGGVLALTGGVGLLVQQNLDRIGPVAIAAGLWIGAVAALGWALGKAPAFSWGRADSTHLAFDYILLLGVLLTGSALAYSEVQFTPLGAHWSYHLLLMSLFTAILAVRGDSRLLAGLALSSFAAWRGVSASPLDHGFWASGEGAGVLRINAILVGLGFVGLGYALVRSQRKPHFEPVASHLGWLMILGTLLSGIFDDDSATGFRLGLFLVGSMLAAVSFHYRRFPLFGMGLISAYIGGSAMLVSLLHDPIFGLLWFAGTGVGMLLLLLLAHKLMRVRE